MRLHGTSGTGRTIGSLLRLLMLCSLAACGGGDTHVGGIQGSGAPVASSAVGAIAGFGSIHVNGVRYVTTGAQISIDDESATESLLRVGQVVTVKGTLNEDGVTGTATSVSFVADLNGPITQLDTSAGTFVVLGQTVRVTDDTLFDEALQTGGIEALTVQLPVRVSGFTTASGEILASRVDPAVSSAPLQVKGSVRALDTVMRRFRINDLVIDYAGIAPDGTLANDAPVVVWGSTVQSNTLVAQRIRVLDGTPPAANERATLSGVITSFTSNASFVLNGKQIVTDASTQFALQGIRLGVDVFVKVDGLYLASGALLATRVEAKRKTSGIVRGLVQNVSASDGTLTVLGITAFTNLSTSFNDKSSERVRTFGLADVRVGDYVELRGTPREGGGLDATLVERTRPEAASHLQGVAENVAEPNLTVFGVQVMTTDDTQFLGGGARRFFDEAPGRVVKLRGTLQGDVFVADRAQVMRN